MFTGIIESLGEVVEMSGDHSNVHFRIRSSITDELKIDQSVAHNGVCLTVVKLDDDTHTVTAIDETLKRSNLNDLKVGDPVNLERCTKVGSRLDGHIVQGHVDTTAQCTRIQDHNGSIEYFFTHNSDSDITVEKGSITVNGVSLTVVHSGDKEFSVTIIPYTLEHTNFKTIELGNRVNIEFDIVGKYVSELLKKRNS